jgi:hypothetical protein
MVMTLEFEREIILSAEMPPARRLEALTWALVQCWSYETGAPATSGGWGDMAGASLLSLLKDLAAIGGTVDAGLAMLVKLRPSRPTPITEAVRHV